MNSREVVINVWGQSEVSGAVGNDPFNEHVSKLVLCLEVEFSFQSRAGFWNSEKN